MSTSFQYRVMEWLTATFTSEIINSIDERNQRFMEEATELVQSTGLTCEQAHAIVDYTYDRPVGETTQEVGGVMNTLAALCHAHRINLDLCADTELDRCWQNIDKIKAKQLLKPRF